MPLFEFECHDCQHRFEELMSAGASELPVCPACQGRQVHRRVSAAAISSGSNRGGSSFASGPACAPSGGG
jgi:putative FmdB family regulatory protein